MKMFRRDSILAILLGLVGLVALRGLTSGIPFGMVIVFFALFAALKVVMGLNTWWHAILGGAVASILWIAFGNSERMTGISLALLPAALAMVAAVSLVKMVMFERRRRSAAV